MEEFIGLAYYAEIPAVFFDVQRTGPSTGMPTRTQQGDLMSLRLRLARRHQAHRRSSRPIPTSASTWRRDAFDLAERFQTPVFVVSRPRHRHERLDGAAPASGTTATVPTAARCSTRRRARARCQSSSRYLDVDGDGIAARTLPGVARQGRVLHARFGARQARRLHRGRRRVPGGDGPPRAQDRHGAAKAVPAPEIHRQQGADDRHRVDRRLRRRGARGGRPAARRRASSPTTCAFAAFPFGAPVARLPRRARASSSSSSRTATRSCARCSTIETGVPREQMIPDARLRRPAAHRAARGRRRDEAPRRERPHDVDRQAAGPAPRAAQERARPHAARLRRRDVDAVRRLRARLGHRRASSRRSGSSTLPPHRAAKMSGIGCSSKTTAYFVRQSHGFNSRARAHAVGRHRAPTPRTATSPTSASPATATRCRSASASCATPSAAT